MGKKEVVEDKPAVEKTVEVKGKVGYTGGGPVGNVYKYTTLASMLAETEIQGVNNVVITNTGNTGNLGSYVTGSVPGHTGDGSEYYRNPTGSYVKMNL